MTSEYAYEVIAAIFLIVVMVSYKKKNWLDLPIRYTPNSQKDLKLLKILMK